MQTHSIIKDMHRMYIHFWIAQFRWIKMCALIIIFSVLYSNQTIIQRLIGSYFLFWVTFQMITVSIAAAIVNTQVSFHAIMSRKISADLVTFSIRQYQTSTDSLRHISTINCSILKFIIIITVIFTNYYNMMTMMYTWSIFML